MPIYRRPGSPHWWLRISVAGVKTRKSTGTEDRQQAEEFEHQERERLWRLHKLGDRGSVLWQEAAKRWLDETTKRSVAIDEMILKWLKPRLNDAPLNAIDNDALEELRKDGIADGMSLPTIDRYMALVRAILKKCADEWRYIERAPKVPMYRAETPEPRWLTQTEFARLLKELPPHLKLCARFSVLTGLRMRSMLALTWQNVDLENRRLRISADKMKTKRAIGLPISKAALQVLRDAKKFSPDGQYVFQFEGNRILDCNTAAFKKAVARAEVEPLRWHDLRHTFASWAIQNGVTMHELMQLGGWSSYAMVQRYAHLAPDHLAAAAEKVGTTKKRPTNARHK